MSTELTARTPLPYRFVRLWVSTIVVFSMTVTLGFGGPGVISRKIDLWSHPPGGGESFAIGRLAPRSMPEPSDDAQAAFKQLLPDAPPGPFKPVLAHLSP